MSTSSNAKIVERNKSIRLQTQAKSTDKNDGERPETFLTIESALPPSEKRKLYKRSHSTLNATSLSRSCDSVNVETRVDGTVHIVRSQSDRDSHPDRISLDRKGLTSFPMIGCEMKLRLLSLQHNLVNSLEGLKTQTFPHLVFLDIYDNQLEHLTCLSSLDNLRVLLVGKNRLKKIDGLTMLKKIEVLDLHGNQISHVTGLSTLTDLKVLNLAGNQIRSIGTTDFQGLVSLQELNLRRNRIKKLLGFGETPNLNKLFISNNDLQNVEDVSSLAKSSNLKEVAIDNNPVFLEGDCVSFLVSYLPQLSKLNTMQVTDQVRKAAMAWRRNKETSNSAFMDLTSDVCLSVRREEIISNARTNWELLRTQTRCLTAKPSQLSKTPLKLNPDSDLIMTSFGNFKLKSVKVPQLINRRLLARTNSQDTETSSSSTTNSEFIKLPPILVPIIKKMEKSDESVKLSGSLSSIGPNFDSSVSSLCSENDRSTSPTTSSSSSSSVASSSSGNNTNREEEKTPEITENPCEEKPVEPAVVDDSPAKVGNVETPTLPESESDSSNKNAPKRLQRTVKSALNTRTVSTKWQTRAQTAKKKQSPNNSNNSGGKDREQGGDYLVEICGRYLNVYGQCALRFIDRSWNAVKANDVTTVKFNYVNFNGIAVILNKLKLRFPKIEHFVFKETNIQTLGQLNALAEVQGLTSIFIDGEGNPICQKNWQSYAIYRLSHWGLKVINDKQISEDDVKMANDEYQSLSDLVLWSLPDVLLQPLLVRLRLDVSHGISEQNAKKWLLSADPQLRSVVSKEALQYKKLTASQEDAVFKQRAKAHISQLLEDMSNSVDKLRVLDRKWPQILHEFVRNTLLDYSQLEMYMKQKILELK